jgi:very-short-patch-repair endonuclease
LCGDSATFQGTERDIVYLSMVADPINRTALTMSRYEQRFNVAMSRARDQVVLVRSVKREHLNPNDLKARLIAHFENPMPLEIGNAAEGMDACESEFERQVMERLLARGYRVRSQVGALGYRIDLVVEGADGRRRLAIECDGDRFHGPAQWHEDMRRQRVLERVGWRFWRCFASSFYREPDATMADLFDTLTRLGIEPLAGDGEIQTKAKFTEHRVFDAGGGDAANLSNLADRKGGLRIGDRVVLLFSDDKSRLSARLTADQHDLERGLLSGLSELGRSILGAEQGDEIDFEEGSGRKRTVLIELVESQPQSSFQGEVAASAKNEANGDGTKQVIETGELDGSPYGFLARLRADSSPGQIVEGA